PSCLSFHSHVPTPHLPSFPTRRSSDLPQLSGEEEDDAEQHGAEQRSDPEPPGAHPFHELAPHDRPDLMHRLVRRPAPPRGRPGRDRKSTRLNSSHRTISYAVFCLKKKK